MWAKLPHRAPTARRLQVHCKVCLLGDERLVHLVEECIACAVEAHNEQVHSLGIRDDHLERSTERRVAAGEPSAFALCVDDLDCVAVWLLCNLFLDELCFLSCFAGVDLCLHCVLCCGTSYIVLGCMV